MSIETLLARAALSEVNHTPSLLLSEMIAQNRIPQTIIVTCADPRVVPESIFQIQPSDNVLVFRTVAGHPQAAVNGILALDLALGIREILILHHTDCGSTMWTEESVREGLKGRCGGQHLEGRVFGATVIPLEQSVKEDVAWLKDEPLMRPELAAKIKGYKYDIVSGKVEEVV